MFRMPTKQRARILMSAPGIMAGVNIFVKTYLGNISVAVNQGSRLYRQGELLNTMMNVPCFAISIFRLKMVGITNQLTLL